MRPIAPRFRLDMDCIQEVPIAEDQHEYKSLIGAIVTYDDGTRQVFARWTFTPEERVRIAAGEDIYLSFPNQMAPHSIELRPCWAD
jgi:hypothetical protein